MLSDLGLEEVKMVYTVEQIRHAPFFRATSLHPAFTRCPSFACVEVLPPGLFNLSPMEAFSLPIATTLLQKALNDKSTSLPALHTPLILYRLQEEKLVHCVLILSLWPAPYPACPVLCAPDLEKALQSSSLVVPKSLLLSHSLRKYPHLHRRYL